MYPGHCTLCIPTENLPGMQRFYEALGMVTTNSHDAGVALSNGDLHIYLMGFKSQLSFNFRGADAFAIHEKIVAAGFEQEGEPRSYKKEQFNADADGSSWMTHDPDGNAVFFDTNQNDIGERGQLQILCRILDATKKQLINVDAPEACRNAFDKSLMARFVTDDAREMAGVPQPPLTVKGRFAGHFTWCLQTKDTKHSCKYYEAIGLEAGEPAEGEHIHMGTSFCDIDLMSFLPGNCFNFRGADVFKVYEQMSAAGLELDGEPVRYTKEEFGQPGGHWQTKDPEGHFVYFDTTDPELIEPGDPKALKRVLERAGRQLADANAPADCQNAFKTEIMDAFLSA